MNIEVRELLRRPQGHPSTAVFTQYEMSFGDALRTLAFANDQRTGLTRAIVKYLMKNRLHGSEQEAYEVMWNHVRRLRKKYMPYAQ